MEPVFSFNPSVEGQKKAIVTLTIGKRYEDMFSRYCMDSWISYCKKYGYDLIAISHPLDNSERAQKRSPAWQKLLILSQDWSSRYERLVWMDTDIIININYALDISRDVPSSKVGAVNAFGIPTEEINLIALERQYENLLLKNMPHIKNLTPGEYYKHRGIVSGAKLKQVVQTGVLVCSPKFHQAVFEHTYNSYEDTHGSDWNYEMPALSYELLSNDSVHWVSTRFNNCVMDMISAFYPELIRDNRPSYQQFINAMTNIYELSTFMHFAGCGNYMDEFCGAKSNPPPQRTRLLYI